MIIENRSKNVQVFHSAGESVILEIGSNILDAKKSKELKAHRLFDANIQAGILKILQDDEVAKPVAPKAPKTQKVVEVAESTGVDVEINRN